MSGHVLKGQEPYCHNGRALGRLAPATIFFRLFVKLFHIIKSLCLAFTFDNTTRITAAMRLIPLFTPIGVFFKNFLTNLHFFRK